VHHLDPQKARFAVYGKGHVWGSPVGVCAECDGLLRAGELEGLVAASPLTRDRSDRDVDEQVRNGLIALLRADLGAVAIAEWLPRGYQELVAQGFLPIAELTGATHVVQAWPDAHRRSVPETRAGRAGDDGMCWFVRSPWPAIGVREVLSVLWAWLESRQRAAPGHDTRHELDLVRELLRHDEAWIRDHRDRQV
jgi:hypothetical protein